MACENNSFLIYLKLHPGKSNRFPFNIKQIQIDGKMDTVHLQKQLQMYIRTKGLSVIARLQCIGIITHNVIKKCLKSQLIWVCSKIGIYLYTVFPRIVSAETILF